MPVITAVKLVTIIADLKESTYTVGYTPPNDTILYISLAWPVKVDGNIPFCVKQLHFITELSSQTALKA
jgi:hypothetical protein